MTQEDRDMLIRVHENVIEIKKDMDGLAKTLYGNGQPGVVSRLQSLETSHQECLKRQDNPRQWPAVVASIAAVVAVVWGFIKQ